MPIAAHIRWLWGRNAIPGAHTTLRTVKSSETWSGTSSARVAGSACSSSVGVRTARSSTSLMASRGPVSRMAVVHSATNWSMSNMSVLPLVELRSRATMGGAASTALSRCFRAARRKRLVAFDILVLGPVRVVAVDGQEVAPKSGRQVTLLAVLAARRDRVVSVDELVDALWGDDLPARPT